MHAAVAEPSIETQVGTTFEEMGTDMDRNLRRGRKKKKKKKNSGGSSPGCKRKMNEGSCNAVGTCQFFLEESCILRRGNEKCKMRRYGCYPENTFCNFKGSVASRETQCAKYDHCSWTGSSCVVSTTPTTSGTKSPTQYPTEYPTASPTNYPTSDGDVITDLSQCDCRHDWMGDNFCDPDCVKQECMWDFGDCGVQYCAQGCPVNWLQDNICDAACNVPECNMDGLDCDGVETTSFPTDYPVANPTSYPTGYPVATTNYPTAYPVTPTDAPAPTAPTVSQYNIDIKYLATPDSKTQAAFDYSVDKWTSIIVGDIPSTYTYNKGRSCYGESGTVLNNNFVVDDLLIFADISYIDGPSNILGQAGPCIIDSNGMPRVGLMQFDSADVGNLGASSLNALILHEMGHIIGIGTLWQTFGVNSPPSSVYTGAGGKAGLADIGGSGSPEVETDGGSGTAYGHWDETTYRTEMMTGWLDSNSKLSALTVKSLRDLSYTVDASQAEAFTMPSGRRLEDDHEESFDDDHFHFKVGDDIDRKSVV